MARSSNIEQPSAATSADGGLPELRPRQVISFDLDGVLFDFISVALREVRNKYAVPLEIDDIISHNYLEEWLLKHKPEAHEYLIEKIVRNPEFYAKLPAMAGAMKVISDLSKDYTIWAITARPWKVVEGTRTKMSEFFPAISDNVLVTQDKVKARKAIGSVLHVEDSEKIVQAMADAELDVIVMDWPYNRKLKANKHIVRAKDMYDAQEIINAALRRAK